MSANLDMVEHSVCVWWVLFSLHQMCVLIIIPSQSGAEQSRQGQVLGTHARLQEAITLSLCVSPSMLLV